MRFRPIPIVVAWLVLGATWACQSQPEDLRTWQPSDHTNTGTAEVRTGSANRPRQSTGEAKQTLPGLDEVTLATWRAKCVLCHGSIGRGDGPQAAMFKPKDLTDKAWQASVTDEQIYTSIQKGKNKMPAFALPEQSARNLVSLVRLLGGVGGGEPAADSAAPTEAATTKPAPEATPSGAAEPQAAPSPPEKAPPAAAGSGAAP